MNIPQSITDYVRLLEDGTPFTYANIGGDGEFLAITGQTGVNSDGRAYNPEVGAALAKVLLEPRLTFHGYNPGRADGRRDGFKRQRAERWLREHGINVPVLTDHALEDPEYGSTAINVRWVHKEIIGSANARGELGPFIRALRARYLVVIGPAWLDGWGFLRPTIGATEWNLFPEALGWEQLGVIRQACRHSTEGAPDHAIVTWSLGYLTKVLMWEFAPLRPDLTHIDVGACWDPYVGILNRHGYRKATWPEAMAKNLREAGIG